MEDKLEEIIVDKDIFVPFNWRDDTPGGSNLGRAEFDICQIYKRRKLIEYFVYPRQQRNQHFYWHVIMTSPFDFSINSYENLDDPKVWLSWWCKEHKTIGFSVYSPFNAHFIRLNSYGIGFTRTDWNKK